MPAFTELPLEQRIQSPVFAARPKKHLALQLQFFTSSANTVVTTSAVDSAKQPKWFYIFPAQKTPFLSTCSPCVIQICRNFTLWVLCLVSSSLERTEGKADGKRWKREKGIMYCASTTKKCFLFYNKSIKIPNVQVRPWSSLELNPFYWSEMLHRLLRSHAGPVPKHRCVLEGTACSGVPGMSSQTECCVTRLLKFLMCVPVPCVWKALPKCCEFILSEFLT